MPTGYTANLEKDYDVKRWIKESVVRAMGVCATLRDTGEMTAKQILSALKKDSDSYYIKKLKDAEKDFKLIDSRTEGEWRDAWRQARAEAKSENEKRLEEFNSKKEKHIAAMNEVSELLKKAVVENAGDVTIGTLRFAQEQLTSAFSFDYGSGPYLNENEDISLEAYKVKCRKKARWDVDYYTEQAAKEKERSYDRAAAYQELVNFVDSK